jgi:leishmanolysin/Big-like domain-containing protein
MVRSSRAFVIGAAVAALVVTACSSGTEPPRATTIQITRPGGAGAFSLTALGQTIQLTAKVLDQNGDTMLGQTVVWATGDAGVATVAPTGLVTAVGNGSTNVTATVGNAAGNITATVGQVAATAQKLQGDGQSGTVGDSLLLRLKVRMLDALNHPIPNAAVTWAVIAGNGSVAGGNADANGDATAKWTLGTTANPGAAVTATSGAISAQFTAIQLAGPAVQITTVVGTGQSATVNTAVSVDPKVKVADAFGNGKLGIMVHWSTQGGRGAVAPDSSQTDANGEATVGSWIVGSVGGTDTLLATFSGGPTARITATVTVAGAPTTIATFYGDNQSGLQGYPLNVRPAARVVDVSSQPVAGQVVTFAVVSGGGSATKLVDTTDANGIAQVGSWTVQSGTNTMTASTGALTPATFTAMGVAPTFNIVIQNIGPALSPAVQQAFDSAVAHWQRIIYVDLPDINIGSSPICGGAGTVSGGIVDDIVILAKIDSLDGPGQILGQAGPCNIRALDATSVTGIMKFDSADIGGLGANLNAVILHEMGHVIGIGSTWNIGPTSLSYTRTCRQNTAPIDPVTHVADGSVDTYYNCASGLAAFDSIGGTSYTGGNKVPVENSGGAGTANGHWRESTFSNELMTGFLNSGQQNPLSLLTVESLQDELYTVNFAAAEPYVHTFTAPAAATAATSIRLTDDIWRGPIEVLDRTGRIVQVLRPR